MLSIPLCEVMGQARSGQARPGQVIFVRFGPARLSFVWPSLVHIWFNLFNLGHSAQISYVIKAACRIIAKSSGGAWTINLFRPSALPVHRCSRFHWETHRAICFCWFASSCLMCSLLGFFAGIIFNVCRTSRGASRSQPTTCHLNKYFE